MTYETAINIYEKLSEDDKVKEVYAHFGLAVYFAQVLEQQSINMIAACKQAENNMTKSADIGALWEEYDFGNKTLGKLIREIKDLYQLSEEDSLELKSILKLRNYIAHDYFRFNSELFYNESGHKRMIKDFIEFQEKAKGIDAKLVRYLKLYTAKMGLTDEYFEKIMKQMEDIWINKVIDENHKTIKK